MWEWVARVLCSGSVTRLQSWCWLGSTSGGPAVPLTQAAVGRNPFLVGCWAKGCNFSWLLAEGHPLCLVTWCCPQGSSQHGSCFIKGSRPEKPESDSKTEVIVFHTLMSRTRHPIFCVFSLLDASH